LATKIEKGGKKRAGLNTGKKILLVNVFVGLKTCLLKTLSQRGSGLPHTTHLQKDMKRSREESTPTGPRSEEGQFGEFRLMLVRGGTPVPTKLLEEGPGGDSGWMRNYWKQRQTPGVSGASTEYGTFQDTDNQHRKGESETPARPRPSSNQ